MLKICKRCGKEFDTNRERKIYCSEECRLHDKYEKVRIKRKNNNVSGKSLKEWCLTNGDKGQRLLDEYCYDNKYTPDIIMAGSNMRVHWKCSTCGYDWYTALANRTSASTGCPACSNQVVNNKNNLLQWCKENGEYGQRLIEEYSSKNELKMNEYTPFSNKQVYWKCRDCGYEWKSIIQNRTRHNCGCIVCSNQVPTENNNLLKWCEENGEYGQKLIEEYSKENELSINECMPVSAKKVCWKCSICGYEWEASIQNRTKHRCGCPACNKKGTSLGEQIIYYILKRELPQYEVLNREKVNGLEVDVLIPKLKFGVEYSGYIYHIDKVEKDRHKIDVLKTCGYNIIVILEHRSSDNIKNMYYDFEFCRSGVINASQMLGYLAKYMYNYYGININTSLSDDELCKCIYASKTRPIDIDEILVLRAFNKSLNNISNILMCSIDTIYRTQQYNIDNGVDLADKLRDIKEIIGSLKSGCTPEEIASNSVEADTSIFEFDVDDKTYDLDFVIKIKSLLEKYEAI